jgi:hypothetical protein
MQRPAWRELLEDLVDDVDDGLHDPADLIVVPCGARWVGDRVASGSAIGRFSRWAGTISGSPSTRSGARAVPSQGGLPIAEWNLTR